MTSAGAGPSVGKHILLAYLPPGHAVTGAELAVEYLGERYPVSVAVAGPAPLFDPENARIRDLPTPTMTPALRRYELPVNPNPGRAVPETGESAF